jgi:hypothetical protein
VETEAREEIEATLAARRELGPGHDDQLIEGFLRRMESEIDRRVDERVGRAVRQVPHARRRGAFNVATMALSIPIIAVAGALGGGLPGVIVAFATLLTIFLVSEFRH